MNHKSSGQWEIPGRAQWTAGPGGLLKLNITTGWSTAEIYLHGAHVAGFQKNGEPPLLFLSRLSRFAAGQAIRGGVPICLPWFGPRAGESAHGFARITEWELVEASAGQDGAVTVRLRLPKDAARPDWPALRAEFTVTISDRLTMELTASNESANQPLEIENCLHTYFQVGDLGAVTLTGLQDAPYDDFAAGANGARKPAEHAPLRIPQETNRVYSDHPGAVEIRDDNLRRIIRVEKFNSRSTVVWNPWTTQQLPDDFDPAEYRRMVCVESGNVKQSKLLLPPGKSTGLKLVLSSRPL